MFSRFSAVLRSKSGHIKTFRRAGDRPNENLRTVSKRGNLLYSTISSVNGSNTGSWKIFSAFALGSVFTTGTGYFLLKDKFVSATTEPKYGSAQDFKNAINELHLKLPDERVSTDEADLHDHGFSLNDYHPGALHSVVVYPLSTEDVVHIVKIANKYRMPVIPYSGGTSIEGHTRGHSSGGICVDMSRMDHILHINAADMDMIVQPGARWRDINDHLKEQALHL